MNDFEFYVQYSDAPTLNPPTNTNHFHSTYEIYYLLENELLYLIDNKLYYVTPGTVIIIPPNTMHTTRPINEANRKRILINLPESYVQQFLQDDPQLLTRLHIPPFSIEKHERGKIEELFYSALNAFTSPSQNTVLLKSILGQLLVNLGVISQDNFKSNTMDYNSTTTKRMLSILDYINTHYSEKITLSSLSRIFYLNPSYISRAFKDKLNISFSDYLRNVRVKETCLLLESSQLKLEEIAEKTGFNNSGDLCRTFKALMHTSPSKYKTTKPKKS